MKFNVTTDYLCIALGLQQLLLCNSFSYKSSTLRRNSNSHQASAETSQLCIIGGGFGGLYTALKLESLNISSIEITLIDPKEKFVFLPLLYELAVGTASVSEVTPTYKSLLKGKKIRFLQTEVSNINVAQRSIETNDNRVLTFDQCIIGVGCQPRIDMIPGASQYALPFYRANDAYQMRIKLSALIATQQEFIRVVVIGGGYSGVEVAASVAQYIGKAKAVVTIIDRNDKILHSSPLHNRNAAERSLLEFGVSMNLNTSVREVNSDGVVVFDASISEEYSIKADLVILTSGVEQADIVKSLNLRKDAYGRIVTSRTLQCIDNPNIFALGDCSSVDGARLPSTAQVAMQQADIVAKNVARRALLYPLIQSTENTFTPIPSADEVVASHDSGLDEVDFSVATAMKKSYAPFQSLKIKVGGSSMNTVVPSNELLHTKQSLPGELDSFTFVPLGEMLTLGLADGAVSSLGGLVRLEGPVAAAARRLVYAARMPTPEQAVVAAVSAGISTASGLLSLLRSRRS